MIYKLRKICCTACLMSLAFCAIAKAQPDVVRAGLSQKGESLILSVWTKTPVPLASYDRRPRNGSSAHFLCFDLAPRGKPGETRVCLGGPKAHHRVGLLERNAAGKVTESMALAASVKRTDPKHLTATLLPRDAGLAPSRYEWSVVEHRPGCGKLRGFCSSRFPDTGRADAFRLRPVRAVGCTGGSAGLVTNGPRDRPVLALTFDDGPSEYTDGFLDVLREKGVPATFFEIGQEMAGREATMRRILGEGDEIGNHTMHHTELPGYSEIAPDSALVESYTHFKPCLFRPPGGASDSAVISTAAGLGMQTITWDVDPRDWTTPGSAAVYTRVVDAARPGSIILMHDGGGPRGGTLEALPRIIDALRARGYRFATVSALLGHRLLYRPYG
jgi:peptidoglycan/xylan/chitin deacetylase (PgdA/CDA1 family)